MTKPIPDGLEGIIPHLCVEGASEAMDFYAKAFGAEIICKAPTPDGKRLMHGHMTIDGNPIYICDDFPEMCDGQSRNPKALGNTPVTIHRFVTDCDAAVKKAEEAGATVTFPPQDTFWGDRYAMVTDPWGHIWSLATRIKDTTPEEMEAGSKAFFG